MATTLSQMLYELENYEYSREHFEMTKLAREIQLMELYEESQKFINDSIDELREDYSNINESYFFEADEDMAIPEVAEKNTKKKNLIVRFFQWIVGLFKKFGAFMKKIWDRITGTRKSVKEANEKIESVIEKIRSDSNEPMDSIITRKPARNQQPAQQNQQNKTDNASADTLKSQSANIQSTTQPNVATNAKQITASSKNTSLIDPLLWELIKDVVYKHPDLGKKYGIDLQVAEDILNTFNSTLDDKELEDKCGVKIIYQAPPTIPDSAEAHKMYEKHSLSMLKMAIISNLGDDEDSEFRIYLQRVGNGKVALSAHTLENIVFQFLELNGNSEKNINPEEALLKLNKAISRVNNNKTGKIYVTIEKSVDNRFPVMSQSDKFNNLTDDQIDSINIPELTKLRTEINDMITTTITMHTILAQFLIKGSALYIKAANQLSAKVK